MVENRTVVLGLVALLAGCGSGSSSPAAAPADPVVHEADASVEPDAEVDAGEVVEETPATELPPSPVEPEAAVDAGAEQLPPPPRSGPETEFVKGRGRCKKQSDCWPDDCCAPATCVSKKFVRKCKTHHCPDMLGPMTGAGAWCACHEGRCGAMYPESHF